MTFHRRLLECLSAIPPSYDALMLSMAPSAYWRLNEGPSATTFADATGNGNTLTGSGSYLPGATPITPNQSTQTAVDFLGTANTLATNAAQGSAVLASGSTWDSSTGVSMSFVGTVDIVQSGVQFPFGKVSSGGSGYNFIINGTTLSFQCAGQTYSLSVGQRSGPVHLAVALDYTITTNAVRIWIDGALTTFNRTGGTTGLSQPTIKFFLGGRVDGFSTKGRMQACAFWFGTAITDAQVQTLYLAHNRADHSLTAIPVIYDNDDGTTDSDDFLDTSQMILNHMRGRFQIIAAIATASDDYAAPAIRQQLNYYGLSAVPVGAFQGAGITSNGSGPAATVRNHFAPSDVRANYTDAATLYQTVLTAAANSSVVVYVGGCFASIAQFLNASAANKTLWNQKVRAVFAVAGQWPNSSSSASPPGNFSGAAEYNLGTLSQSAADFVSYSTTPTVYWSGVELCGNTGNAPALGNFIQANTPSYWNNSVNPIGYPSGFTRTSWGSLGMHQGIEFLLRGAANVYYTANAMAAPTINNVSGANSINAGSSVHQYLTPKLGPLTLAQWQARMALLFSTEMPPNTNTYT